MSETSPQGTWLMKRRHPLMSKVPCLADFPFSGISGVSEVSD